MRGYWLYVLNYVHYIFNRKTIMTTCYPIQFLVMAPLLQSSLLNPMPQLMAIKDCLSMDFILCYDSARLLMSWDITPVNFEMILDAELPGFIGSVSREVLQKAADILHFNPGKIGKSAIHPGGKKILDIFKKKFNLTDEKLKSSYKVLNKYGNMSSPTVLFVMNGIIEDIPTRIIYFSVGFGPGIAIDSALLTYVS